MVGQTLGHYRILEKIGEGGMGVVYRARDERLDRDVALKVLPSGALTDEAARKRFRKEALALAKLNHPHIEAVYEFGSQGGADFLVMEYAPGVTLAERLAAGALPEKEVLALGAQITAALEEAHEQGVVHRDLKPGNIVVTPKGQAKVLDFGLAKLLRPESEISTADQLSSTAAGAGTLPYMSPEQLQAKPADARSDIYAAGVVLYEMATGSRPFPDKVGTALVADILHRPPPPPGRLKHDLSPRLEGIILKCLEKDPENRYQSTKELAVDLRRLAMPSAVTAAPSALRAWRKAGRPTGYGVAGLLALVALLVGLNVGGWRSRLLGRASSPHIDSLAVLPIANLSGDPQQEYFADGMTEALITDLSKIGALRVISRTSVMRFKGTRKALPEIAQDLKVDAVVEGAVLRSGNRVRITAQLIHVATDRHLWAETYERDLSDILALQSQVTRDIAEQIRVKLTPQEQQRLERASHINPEAYEAYLKGRYLWDRRNEQSLKKSVEYFNEAIGKEPTYALAYAGLADSYNILGNLGFLPPGEAYPRARAAATKALEQDSTLGEAHAALALASLVYDWNWPAAEEEFKRAIELSPNYGPAHQWYAVYLMALGRHDEALTETNRAAKLDPLSPTIASHFGWILYNARRYDQAIERCRKALEMDPNFAFAHIYLARAYLGKGMYAEALAEFEKASPLFVTGKTSSPELGYIYAVTGKRGDAQKEIDQYKQRWKQTALPSLPYYVAVTYAGLGDKDQAFIWLQKAYEEHYAWLILLKVEPRLDSLRSDPRFQDLLRRVGPPA